MFSATVRSVKIPPSSGAKPRPRWAISWVRRPWMASPWKTMRPARGRRYPMIARSVVVLPAPLRPDQADHLAVADLEGDLAQDVARLDEDVDALDGNMRSWSGPADHHVHHALVGADRGGRRVGQDLPLVERDDAIRVAKDDIHVVLDLDDRLDVPCAGTR